MDSDLKAILSLARHRGSKYIKKDYSTDEFSEQMAELGIYLLEKVDRRHDNKEGRLSLKELNDIQQRVDHFRKAIFSLKRSGLK